MSDFEMNEGQCFIFQVKPEGNKPTVKGKAKIDGVEYEISLWPSKSGKQGSYSGKISLPYNKTQGETHKGMNRDGDVPSGRDDMDDQIPFMRLMESELFF